HQRKDPDRFIPDLMDETIVLVLDQLACIGDSSCSGRKWKARKPQGSAFEQHIHSGCGTRIVGGDMVKHVGTVPLGFRRPDDPHASPSSDLRWSSTRRRANTAS